MRKYWSCLSDVDVFRLSGDGGSTLENEPMVVAIDRFDHKLRVHAVSPTKPALGGIVCCVEQSSPTIVLVGKRPGVTHSGWVGGGGNRNISAVSRASRVFAQTPRTMKKTRARAPRQAATRIGGMATSPSSVSKRKRGARGRRRPRNRASSTAASLRRTPPFAG